MINWIRNLFLTKDRALNELRQLCPATSWRIVFTDAGTVKVFDGKTLMTHRPSLALCMSRIRKYIKPLRA